MTGRERRLIDTFVFLADTLVAEADADALLHTLVARCVELLDADAAGVMLALGESGLRAVAASSRDMSQLEIFEIAVKEGPSYDAYGTGRPVVVRDLHGAEQRWPTFTPRARALGFRAGYGMPLRLRDRTIGSLNLFQSEGRRPLDDADARVAQGFADVATIGLLQQQTLRDADLESEQLAHALQSRIVIEQAKGILSERHAIDPLIAFERLRKHARDHNRKLREVASDVVDQRLDLS